MKKFNVIVLSLACAIAFKNNSFASAKPKPSPEASGSADLKKGAEKSPSTATSAAAASARPSSPKKTKLRIDIPLGAAIANHYKPNDNSPSIEKINAFLEVGHQINQSMNEFNTAIDQAEAQDKPHLQFMYDTARDLPVDALFKTILTKDLTAIKQHVEPQVQKHSQKHPDFKERESTYSRIMGKFKPPLGLAEPYEEFSKSASSQAKAAFEQAIKDKNVKTTGDLLIEFN